MLQRRDLQSLSPSAAQAKSFQLMPCQRIELHRTALMAVSVDSRSSLLEQRPRCDQFTRSATAPVLAHEPNEHGPLAGETRSDALCPGPCGGSAAVRVIGGHEAIRDRGIRDQADGWSSLDRSRGRQPLCSTRAES